MSDLTDAVHTLITEVRTEALTADVALSVIGISAVVYVVATVRTRHNRRSQTDTLQGEAGWGAARILALLTVFSLLAMHVHRAGWLASGDNATLSWFIDHRTPAVTAIARAVTDVAGPIGTLVLGVLVAVLVWRDQRSVVPAVVVIGTVAVAAAASTLTKIALARPRPPAAVHLVTETDFSFPSGHVTGTVALVGATLVVVTFTRTRARVAALALAVFVVTLVAGTRLYLGVHWLTDVVGGALLGVVAATAGAAALYMWRLAVVRPTVGLPAGQLMLEYDRTS